jgi:hypothetical protein
MDELAQRIAEYAAKVHEANKRTLDPIIIELIGGRGLTESGVIGVEDAWLRPARRGLRDR